MSESMTEVEAAVEVTGDAAGFAQDIVVGTHRLRADEPAIVGGTATGPTPYQLLMAALGSCTSMTVAMYARRKQWPLKRVSVRLSHQNIHAVDCASCDVKEGPALRITRELTLEGELDAAQRQRLLEMANRCPVHRTLTGQMDIVTHLA
jgi:putative redox protein